MINVFCHIVFLLLVPTSIEAAAPQDSVFYRNEGINIEFRVLLEEQEKTPWIMLQDQEGTPQKVSKKIVISNDDVAGFTTYDYRPNFDDDTGFTIHFKPDSWKKIGETTGKLKGKRVALVRDGEIFWSPMMHEALFRSAVVSLGGEDTSVEKLLKDFSREKLPEQLRSETLYEKFLADWIESHPNDLEVKNSLRNLSSQKIYEQFLVDWIDSHPKDWETMYELVNYYLEDKNHPEVKKALPLAQKLVKIRPEDSQMQDQLMQCYLLMGNNDKALATAIQALSHTPDSGKMFQHRVIGELQYQMGQKKEALESLEASLVNIKQTEFPTPDKTLAEITGVVLPKKEDMIRETINRINFILAH